MTIDDINCKYLEWFDPLYRAEGKRPDKFFKMMSDVLIKLYEQEVEDFLDEQMLAFAMQRFELKFKVKMYTPRRIFLCWNKTAKKLLKQYKAAFNVFLAELQKSAEEEKSYAEELKSNRPSDAAEAEQPQQASPSGAQEQPSQQLTAAEPAAVPAPLTSQPVPSQPTTAETDDE